MADAVKICRECKYCQPDRWFMPISCLRWLFRGSVRDAYRFAKCTNPQTWMHPNRIHPVTGEIKPAVLIYCETERLHDGPCGKEGKLFEPRE